MPIFAQFDISAGHSAIGEEKSNYTSLCIQYGNPFKNILKMSIIFNTFMCRVPRKILQHHRLLYITSYYTHIHNFTMYIVIRGPLIER